MYCKCAHCGEELDVRMSTHKRKPSVADTRGAGYYALPKTWRQYAGMLFKDIHAIDPLYLDSLLTRAVRPVDGKLADAINDFMADA